MKTLFVFAGLILGVASAEARPDSLKMTCAEAAALVQQSGAITIGTGRWVYDRFVTDQRFCQRNEYTYPAWIATMDDAQCFVGYVCRTRDHD